METVAPAVHDATLPEPPLLAIWARALSIIDGVDAELGAHGESRAEPGG